MIPLASKGIPEPVRVTAPVAQQALRSGLVSLAGTWIRGLENDPAARSEVRPAAGVGITTCGPCPTAWMRSFASLLLRRPWPAMALRKSSTPTRAASSPARFVDVLKDAGVRVSMGGRGRWMDNVFKRAKLAY